MEIETIIFGDIVSMQIHGRPRDKTLFVIPPGGLNFDHQTVANLLGQDNLKALLATYQVLIFNYPGIGQAPAYNQTPTVAVIADKCLQLIRHKNLSSVSLIGISFGGSVAMEMLDREPDLFTKSVIAASGEYLNTPKKQIFNLFTALAVLSPRFNYFVYFSLVKVFRLFSDFKINDLPSLVQMGRSIFLYRIKPQTHHSPTMLISCTTDTIVRAGSQEKLTKKFPNHLAKSIDVRHAKDLRPGELVLVEKLVTNEIIPFLLREKLHN